MHPRSLVGAQARALLYSMAPYTASSAAFWPLAWPLAQAHGWAFLAGLLYLTACWLFWHAFMRWLIERRRRGQQAADARSERATAPRFAALLAAVLHALLSMFTLSDSLAYFSSGFHITPTLVSALWEEASAVPTAPDTAFIAAIAAASLYGLVAGLNLLAAHRAAQSVKAEQLVTPTTRKNHTALPIIGFTAFLAAQLIYSAGYIVGQTNMLQLRRISPYFVSLEGWRLRAAARSLGIEIDNPFALATRLPALDADKGLGKGTDKDTNKNTGTGSHRATRALTPLKHPLPDVLIIVADSLRATTPTPDYNFAPLTSGTLSDTDTDTGPDNGSFWDYRADGYQSTANCTHFAMFTLLSGKLPSEFSKAREAPSLTPALRWFTEKGYTLSSSEATSLDWYDTAKSLWGSSTVRRIASHAAHSTNLEPSGPEQISADQFVMRDTLSRLLEPTHRMETTTETGTKASPKLHLAYFYGTHFPYGDTVTEALRNGPELYAAAIKRLDADISDMLAKLAARGELDNTLILLTADHGESFSGTRPQGHAGDTQVDQRSIPLLVRLPDAWRTSPERTSAALEAFRASNNQRLFMSALQAAITSAAYEDIAALQRHQQRAAATPPIYAGCDYDYPNSFTLSHKGKPYRFLHDDGFLYLEASASTRRDKSEISAALNLLLRALNDE